MKTILIIEDDYHIASPVKEFLEKNNYKVIWSSTGFEALEDVKLYDIDLILLDLMMPDLDGYGFLERFRKYSDTPVIIISARTAVKDKVRGFELGADDYLTKPFSLTETKARIEYHLKKKTIIEKVGKVYRFTGGLTADLDKDIYDLNGSVLFLTDKEKGLLKLLIDNKGRIITKEEIYENIWFCENKTDNNTVTVHIKTLREKLKEDLKSPKFIETVWGKGYRFIGEEV